MAPSQPSPAHPDAAPGPAGGAQPALTIATAAQWRALLLVLLETSPAPSLDLAGVDQCDTLGLQLLGSAVLSARAAGKTLRILHPAACIVQACRSAGIQPSDIGIEVLP